MRAEDAPMMDLPHMGIRRRTPETQRWLFRAIVASAVTGGAIYVLAIHVVLPALASRFTPAQIGWFRQAFVHHPLAGFGEIVAVAAVPWVILGFAFRVALCPPDNRYKYPSSSTSRPPPYPYHAPPPPLPTPPYPL